MTTPMGLGMLSGTHIMKSHRWRRYVHIKGKNNLCHEFKDRIRLNPKKVEEVEEKEINFLGATAWIPGKTIKRVTEGGHIFSNLSLSQKIDLMELAAAKQPIECTIEIYDGCGVLLETYKYNNTIMNIAKEDNECDPCFYIEWEYESYDRKDFTQRITV